MRMTTTQLAPRCGYLVDAVRPAETASGFGITLQRDEFGYHLISITHPCKRGAQFRPGFGGLVDCFRVKNLDAASELVTHLAKVEAPMMQMQILREVARDAGLYVH